MSRLDDIRQCEKDLDAIDLEVDSDVTRIITRACRKPKPGNSSPA